MTSVRELDCQDAFLAYQEGALLVDIRDAHECLLGRPEGAVTNEGGDLVSLIRDHAETDSHILCICQRGTRSKQAANELYAAGYHHVATITGGFDAWRKAGLPVVNEADRYGLNASQFERYARHITLPEVGASGQATLLNSQVVLVGVGGLGSPAALYLAAAGIGHLIIIDDDIVERSNLQRQILHRDASQGSKKLLSAREQLLALNPGIQLTLLDTRLNTDNATECIAGSDVVIDGSDNFSTRYALNAACVQLEIPLVYAAVERFQAHLAVFWPLAGESYQPDHLAADMKPPCYRCVFPLESDRPGCAEAGILGAVPGVAGCLQALEAIKLCLGIGQPVIGRLLRMDLFTMDMTISQLLNDPDCPVCSSLNR